MDCKLAKQFSSHGLRFKIVFLSMNNDKGLMEAALAMGAKGYVLKVNASRELLPTISRALLGRPFVPELR